MSSKAYAVIQARMLSSRLRGKSLMAVGGKPLLVRVIRRVRAMDFIDDIIVATSTDLADDPIEAMMRQMGIRVFRGDRADVLDRFNAATSSLDPDDCIIRFTADNPMYDPEASKAAYAEHLKSNADYTHVTGLSHVVPEFIQIKALRLAADQATESFDREHVTPLLRKNPQWFSIHELAADFGGLRPELDPFMTIDNQSQLEAFEQMLKDVEVEGQAVELAACYRWLDRKRAGLTTAASATISEVPFKIAGREVGPGRPCFVVAEIGQNHNGQVGMAKKLIDMAANAGCDAVKFQKREIKWELTAEAYHQPYDNPNSFGSTYGQHREYLELNEDQHKELREYALARGLIYFCTACDPPSVDLLERVGNPVYKIASRDITNIPLLRCVADTGKPVVLSTGMADMNDIREAIEALGGDTDSILITHCVSQYPTEIENVNLRAMETIRQEFGCQVGLSDHTTGIITCVAAAVMGAPFIEKHVTLSRAMPGTDHAAALEEEGLRRMIRYIRLCEQAMGNGEKAFLPVVETAKRKLARSLTSADAIPAGTVVSESMLVLKSPGTGLAWKDRDRIIGKTARSDIPADTTLEPDQFQ